eukprot:TRINITY_DN12488_c0_g2_i2.p1 TRINITY_DN12488_c0_g2~~TRINITY_DN12488_c0_g2_i2.p1  ORF type:complete len:524 (-),score=19.40 TRINITY_DN12488_c0_g2_i2:45-1616(-)
MQKSRKSNKFEESEVFHDAFQHEWELKTHPVQNKENNPFLLEKKEYSGLRDLSVKSPASKFQKIRDKSEPRMVNGSGTITPISETKGICLSVDETRRQLNTTSNVDFPTETASNREPEHSTLFDKAKLAATEGVTRIGISSLLKKRPLSLEDTSVRVKNKSGGSDSRFESLICLQHLPPSHMELSLPRTVITCMSFSPNGLFFATGASDGLLRVYRVLIQDLGTRKLLSDRFQVYQKHAIDITDINWSPDSEYILTGSLDKRMILWNRSLPNNFSIFDHPDVITSLSFHPKINGVAIVGSFDKILRVWDLAEHKVLDWVTTHDVITALAVGFKGRMIACGFLTGSVRFYDYDGKLKFISEVDLRNERIGKRVTHFEFVNDECEVLVTTTDSTIRLLDIPTCSIIQVYKGHVNNKLSLKAHYDEQNHCIIMSSEEGRVYIWNKYVNRVDDKRDNRSFVENKKFKHFRPFKRRIPLHSEFVPFMVLSIYREKAKLIDPDYFVHSLIVSISEDGDIKVDANLRYVK